jgi:hypothetical protein
LLVAVDAVGDLLTPSGVEIDPATGDVTGVGSLTIGDDLDMGGNDITNVGDVDGRDVSADGAVLDTAILDGDFGATGLMVETGAGAYTNRSIAVGSAKLTVANASGAAGNPTLDFGAVASTDLSDTADIVYDGDFGGNGWCARTGAGAYEARTLVEGSHIGIANVGVNWTLRVADIGIADDDLVEIDDAAAASGEYCRLTANGIEGRSFSERLEDNVTGWSVYCSSNQSVNNITFTKVQFNTELRDTESEFNTATYRCTPAAGKYRMGIKAGLSQTSNATQLIVSLYKNGARFADIAWGSVGAWHDQVRGDTIEVSSNGTDYWEVFIYHNHGSARNTLVSRYECYWWGERIE